MVINQSTQDGKTYTYPPQTHMGSSNNSNNNNMNNNVYYMAEPAGPSVMMPQQPQPQPQQPAPVYHYPQQQQPQPHYNPFAANASAGLVFGSPQPHAMQPGMVPQQQQQQQQQPIPFQMQSTVPYHPQLQQHPQPQYAQQAYVVQPSVYGVSVVNSNQSYENPSEDQNSLLFFILGFFFNIFWVIGACTYSGSRSTTARRYAKYSRNLCILVTVLVLASIAINFAVFLVEYH